MKSQSRRRFLMKAAAAAAIAPVVMVDSGKVAWAEDLPQLTLDDPTANALGYLHDTSKVDGGKYPNHKASQNCANCRFIQADSGEWRPCQLFPGKAVNENGWCASWAAMA